MSEPTVIDARGHRCPVPTLHRRMLFGDIGRDGVRMESVRTALALLNEALD